MDGVVGRLVGFLLLLPVLAGCVGERRVLFSLEWDVAGTERSADGAALLVRNDLGYQVWLRRGFLASHPLDLVECAEPSPPLARLAAGAAALLAPAPAWAGHVLSLNPSAFRPAIVESLLAAAPATSARVLVAGRRYCELNYLVARADTAATGLPDDLAMAGKSLYLEGMVAAPGAPPVPFTIATSVTAGRRLALRRHADAVARSIAFDSTAGDAVVRVRRCMASLFDGVDFVRQPRSEWPHRILANLVDDLAVVVEAAETEPR